MLASFPGPPLLARGLGTRLGVCYVNFTTVTRNRAKSARKRGWAYNTSWAYNTYSMVFIACHISILILVIDQLYAIYY